MLALWALVLGLCIGRNVPRRPSLADGVVAICFGALFAWLGTYWLSLFYLQKEYFFHADFIEYCNGVSTPALLDIGASSKRSAFPMLLPRLFEEAVGVFNALAAGSFFSSFGMGAALYLWGVFLGGRRLAIAVVVFALFPTPMTFLGRLLSSYPEMTLCFVVGATTCCWGIVSTRPIATLAGGIGVAVVLLADTRGIVWACPLAAGLLVAVVLRGTWWNRILRLLALVIPIAISHEVAAQFYVPEALGLEHQADIRPMLHRMFGLYPPPYDYATNYTWGLRPLSQLPTLIEFMLQQSQYDVPTDQIPEGVATGRLVAAEYLKWAIVGLVVAVVRWWRKPWTLFALIVSISPFLMGFRGLLIMLEEHPRFYIQTLPGLIVLWAIAWVALVDVGGWCSPRILSKLQVFFRWPTYTIVLFAILLGGIPTQVSPTADWRRAWKGTDDRFGGFLARYHNKAMHRHFSERYCRKALDDTLEQGLPLYVTLYEEPAWQWIPSLWEEKD